MWNLDHSVEQSKPSSKQPPETHSDPNGLLIFPHGGVPSPPFFGINFPTREIKTASLCWLESFRLWGPLSVGLWVAPIFPFFQPCLAT